MRVGIGYDVHRLVNGEKLILGGVNIDHALGLKGHSDADVLVHAIMDAILGAIGAGDIGKHFPDSDSTYKDISSLRLLKKVQELLLEQDYEVNNLDATIIAQEPKLAPYLAQMKEKIANVLNISIIRINLKATTTEGLGFTGNKEGIAVQAIVSVE
ncbi:2-C-methyl-D-erythritol 2,4-cyclodiphosphate synthase [Selenihalanaerobacter shriftii]|uniref:2-C-methyl-D-erythritol 2,4-cyclodiphosphate synthase n=1 Tax=Selenihalanaerobacter shriftii TaxID=142842 RepID=A0A1T4QD11_9FIRM|nr:2-C-methyl-D-erythritol 2,4-cyclodiphosphate synthase [Selenihalanaerobacter shriftii]SKA01506.1 2-C-methyl-D-erythritol 2,4-cyclodiphosphate synthase [Selenihalanaerobacter shriftii]